MRTLGCRRRRASTNCADGVLHAQKPADISVSRTSAADSRTTRPGPRADTLLLNTGRGAAIIAERFDNAGFGHVAGFELLVRKNLSKNLFGWLSYTFSRAFYDLDDGEGLVRFDFDQPHILTAVAVYKLPRDWSIGGRFRLVSGNPYTPVRNGIYDASTDSYFPLNGPRNSARQAAFHHRHAPWMSLLSVI